MVATAIATDTDTRTVIRTMGTVVMAAARIAQKIMVVELAMATGTVCQMLMTKGLAASVSFGKGLRWTKLPLPGGSA